MNEDCDFIVITDEEEGFRLDKILAGRYQEIRSRTYFQDLIEENRVFLNGYPVKKRVKPCVGDEVEIHFLITPEIDLIPEAIPLKVIYEDDHILVVNKEAGMVVHPATGHWTGTFVNALLHHCKQIDGEFSSLRPGIVHRLDKETSGVLIAAKTSLAHQRLVAMFAERKVYKEYLAVCIGNPGKATLSAPIGRHSTQRKLMSVVSEGGKEALTLCQTLACDGQISCVSLVLATGRTHQIRVHMKHHGTPVLGDSTYGNPTVNQRYNVHRQMLHAYRLRLKHPMSEEELAFEAEIPEDMAKVMQKIDKRALCPMSSK